jgi:1-deoxy-D-xylulose-5-phosphate reductoisomerase
VAPYAWETARSWTFEAPDLERFPCLGLAFAALREGGTAPALLNAANEVAVAAFLQGQLGFWDIQACCQDTLTQIPATPLGSLAQVLDADRAARRHAEGWVQARA